MWNSSQEVTVTEMSEVSYKVTSNVEGRQNTLRRSPKTKMADTPGGVREKRVSGDAIPLPWVEKKPKKSTSVDSDTYVSDSKLADGLPPEESGVSDKAEEKVVIALKWIDVDLPHEDKSEDIRASLTLANGEKANHIITLSNIKVKANEMQPTNDDITQNLPKENILTTSDRLQSETCKASYSSKMSNVQPGSLETIKDLDTPSSISSQDTPLLIRAKVSADITVLPIEHTYSTVGLVTNNLAHDTTLLTKDVDRESVILPARLSRGINNELIKPRFTQTDKDISVYTSGLISKTRLSPDPPDSSMLLTKSYAWRRRLSASRTDSPLYSSIPLVSHRFTSTDVRSSDDIPILLERIRRESRETQRSRDSTPFPRTPLILTEVNVKKDIGGGIVAEADLLATYHGAGVLSPLTIDDVPETPAAGADFRRERSVSVMRRLLSDGGVSAQLSRESTPMSDLRRRFKVQYLPEWSKLIFSGAHRSSASTFTLSEKTARDNFTVLSALNITIWFTAFANI